MRCDELLKLKKLTATENMIKAMFADLPEEKVIYAGYRRQMHKVYTHRYHRFYYAAVEKGILKVGIWQRGTLERAGQEPDYTIFIDAKKKEWITYTGIGWTAAKIFNLDYESDEGQKFGIGNWNSKASLKAAASYLGITGATVKEVVRKYQTLDPQTAIYHKNEREQIDEFMERVPELPKGFNNDWLIRTAFIDLTSIMYRPGKNVGYCTRCQTAVQLREKPGHLKETKCPNCHAAAHFRSWRKQQSFERKKWVGVLQKLNGNDGYCLSQYEVRVSYRQSDDYAKPQIYRGRVERYRMTSWFDCHESFAYEMNGNSGITRWNHAHPYGEGWSYRYPQPYCTLYEGNITRLLKGTQCEYVPVADWLRRNKGKQFDFRDAMRIVDEHADTIEKLIKAGLYRLTHEALTQNKIYEMNTRGKKLKDILKLSAEYTLLARKLDCTWGQLKVLRAADQTHVWMDEETVKTLDEFVGGRAEGDIYLTVVKKNMRKMLNYLKKVKEESKNPAEIVYRDYEDYLNQLHRLGIREDRHTRFPANFYNTHEELSRQIKELDDRIASATTRKKNEMLRRVVKRQQPLYETESKKYMIVWPKSKAEFAKEGQEQHNCVGGYFEKCVKEETTVFFVRRKEEPDKPYATVEFDRGSLVQCRIAYNNNAPEDVMRFMDRIAKHYQMTMKELQEA